MTKHALALFGEAEKGEFHAPYFCQSLTQLSDYLGNPPPSSKGLTYAIQALLFNYHLFFFRVEEEGFSIQDYLLGLSFLESQEKNQWHMDALCMPGVGDAEILDIASPFCLNHGTFIIVSESDLYDYLTRY